MGQVQNGHLYKGVRSMSMKNKADEWKSLQTTSRSNSVSKSSCITQTMQCMWILWIQNNCCATGDFPFLVWGCVRAIQLVSYSHETVPQWVCKTFSFRHLFGFGVHIFGQGTKSGHSQITECMCLQAAMSLLATNCVCLELWLIFCLFSLLKHHVV